MIVAAPRFPMLYQINPWGLADGIVAVAFYEYFHGDDGPGLGIAPNRFRAEHCTCAAGPRLSRPILQLDSVTRTTRLL